MALPSKDRVPALVAGVDVRSLPLGHLEGFVLSRIDGIVSVGDLANVTGLGEEAVGDIMLRLITLGAVTLGDRPERTPRPPGGSSRPGMRGPSSAPAAPPPPSGPATGTGASQPAPTRTAPVPPVRSIPPPQPQTARRALYDPVELEEDVDLDPDRRRRILDAFYRLDAMTHYDVLGVKSDADKKVIRDAYFALSKDFHPDTMFRKRLGSYKAKMEAIFTHLTEAYEVLGKKKAREEYDAYLRTTGQIQQVEEVLQEGEREAERATPGVGLARPEIPGAPSPLAPPAVPRIAPSADERRRVAQEILERKLGKRSGETSSPGLPSPATRTAGDAAKDLARAVLQSGSGAAGGDLVGRHVSEAKTHESQGDLPAAVNAMRLAVALAPDRPELAVEHLRLSQLLATQLAPRYTESAKYEEGAGKWGAAALSWGRVCDGRPDDAEPHRRAAEALLKVTGGDLRRAQKFAQRAVELAPEDARCHRALGRVFQAIGLKLNAVRALEAAAKLDPADELVKNLLRELKS